MLRYLSQAFWACPHLPGLGRIPINALALLGFGILGFGHESFWFLGAGLEVAYLAALVASDRFRAAVDAAARKPAALDAAQRHADAVAALTDPRRARHEALLTQIQTTLRSYRKGDIADLLAETNRTALDQLADLHLRLLAAQQHLDALHIATDADALHREIALVRRELASEKITPTLRESKQATLAILEQRRTNLSRRDDSLAEIEGDLDRIEAQVSLARENAAMGNQPEAVSSNINLATHLLDDPTRSGDSTPSPQSQ